MHRQEALVAACSSMVAGRQAAPVRHSHQAADPAAVAGRQAGGSRRQVSQEEEKGRPGRCAGSRCRGAGTGLSQMNRQAAQQQVVGNLEQEAGRQQKRGAGRQAEVL